MTLYSTDPLNLRGTLWRFAIDAGTGRGEFQYQDAGRWLPLSLYNHRAHGLVTLNELDRALYQPSRNEIQTAREACVRVAQAFQLTTQQMVARQASLI